MATGILAMLLGLTGYVAVELWKRLSICESMLSRRQQQFDEMAEKYDEMTIVAGEEVGKREKLQTEHQQQVETLQAVIDLRDKGVRDVRATLDKRDAELKNMSESMREARIRAEANTEGLEKLLRQEQQTTKQLRHRLTEAERKLELAQGSIEGQRRENQSAIRHHAECVRQRDQLATELYAAKTLLAGVKIGVGELLIVQPDGECTEEALDALRSQMGPIDGKVVVVRHVNAWRATPIPRATATNVEESAQDSLADVSAEKQRLRIQLDECRSKREAITFERDAYARDFAKLQLDHANTVALLESVQRELGDFQTLFDVLTCFEVNGSFSGMQSTGEWNQINIGLSSRLIHPAHTGDGRSAPAATVANRDTSKNGPTSEQLQALADLLLAGLQRKYPLLATGGPKDVAVEDTGRVYMGKNLTVFSTGDGEIIVYGSGSDWNARLAEATNNGPSWVQWFGKRELAEAYANEWLARTDAPVVCRSHLVDSVTRKCKKCGMSQVEIALHAKDGQPVTSGVWDDSNTKGV